jgi:hypothetical protein
MEIGLSQYSQFFNDCGVRIYSYTHWSALSKHPLLINDPTLIFAQLKEGENSLESAMFMIINGSSVVFHIFYGIELILKICQISI